MCVCVLYVHRYTWIYLFINVQAVCSYMYRHTFIYAIWKPQVLSLGAIHLFFGDRVFYWPALTEQTGLVGQWVSRIHVSLSPQCKEFRMSPNPEFVCGFRELKLRSSYWQPNTLPTELSHQSTFWVFAMRHLEDCEGEGKWRDGT